MYGFWDMERNRQNSWSFWTVFRHFINACHKWQSYYVWFLEFFVILDNFLPFYPPRNQKNQNFEKKKRKKKKTLEIISFDTNVPQIMIICYTVPQIWHMMDVTVMLHFGLFFALLPPPFPPSPPPLPPSPPPPPPFPWKRKISKKWKKQLEISSFYTSVPKIIIIWYTVAEIQRMMDVIIFHFGLFWSFYLPFPCSWWKQIINTLSFSYNNLALLRKIHCKSSSTSLIFFLPFCQAWRSFSQGVFKSFSKSLESAILS